MELRVFIYRPLHFCTSTFIIQNLVGFRYAIRYHYVLTIVSNGASTSGLKSVLIICSWVHCFVAFCKYSVKMFDKETFHKILSYAFLKIQAHQAWKIDAAVCFSLYLLRNFKHNNFLKTFLWEVLNQIKFILWFRTTATWIK